MRQVYSLSVVLLAMFIIPACTKTDMTPAPVAEPEHSLKLASKKAKGPAEVAIDWMNAYRAIVQSEGKNPPQASRIYAYAAIGLYEAVVPGIGGYHSLEGQISGLNNIPKVKKGKMEYTTSANEALYRISLSIFGTTLKPQNLALIETLHKQYADEAIATLKTDVVTESTNFGYAVALAVLDRAGNDNFASTRTLTYVVPSASSNPGYWSPTSAVTNPLEPYWGTIKCFAMANGGACTVKSSIPFSTAPSSRFYQQALEVATTGNTLTQTQKDIALWWADNAGATPTPPGHWVGISANIADQLNLDLGKTAEMFAKVNIAMADAFISCWDEKYKLNLLRPVTYIHTYIPNQTTWSSFIGTPPFPEYPSGHSVSSGAAADVLTKMFGKVAFTDDANVALNLTPRTFTSFEQAANEAAISRLYGGIHFREAIENGIKQGKEVSKALQANLKFK